MTSESVVAHHSSIDWKISIKLANDNKELAKDLLEMFIADLPKASEAINRTFDVKQYNELLQQVHKLHGASCYCGVTKLKEILAKMEFALKERMYSQFEQALSEFDDEVNNVLLAYKMIDFE